MHGASRGQGLSRTIFALLLVAFSWPVLSIPQAGGTLLWLFAAWAAGIVLLLVCARLTLRHGPVDDTAASSTASTTPGSSPPETGMAPGDTAPGINTGGPDDD